MKKTKIALTLVCAILIVAASVMGTLAYLTDKTEAVTNTFTVGNVSFALNSGLDEAKTNAYGKPVKNTGTEDDPVYAECNLEDAPRVIGNEYKLIPGHNYTKDPTVHMGTTSEDAYLFVTVANGISTIEAGTTIASQMTAKGWKEVKENNAVVAYVYYGTTTTKDPETGNETTTVNTTRAKVTAGQNIVVFDEFTLKTDADVSDYANAQIVIKAYAIQADGLEDKTDNQLWNEVKPST